MAQKPQESAIKADQAELLSQVQVREKNSSPTPSKVLNSLEDQMQQKIDPKIPRGEPQLVGLTRIRYSPTSLNQEESKQHISSNFITQSLTNFYPDKQKSKRVQKMRSHSQKLAGEDLPCYLVNITLPFPALIEQINLRTPSQGKYQSKFSQVFQLATVKTERDDLLLKSAFSECVTRNGRIEYNLIGVCQTLTLVFKKDSASEQPVELDQIKLKVKNQADSIEMEDRIIAQGNVENLINDDEEDFRILDSLPAELIPKQDKLFNQLLSSIEIVGFNLTAVPAITNLTYFMNQSFYLKNRGRIWESEQVDLLSSQLLVTTKRATQAAEMYRKAQFQIVQNNSEHQTKKLIDCAVLELLIADAMPSDISQNEKIFSIQRLSSFLKGDVPADIGQRFIPPILFASCDQFSAMLKDLPEILRFILACLSHRMEIVKISALKLLKFVLETQGCSLDFGLVFTLRCMLNIYPDNLSSPKAQIQPEFNLLQLTGKDITISEFLFKRKLKEKQNNFVESNWIQIDEPASGFKKALTSVYQHVLDTVVSVLSSVSSHILHAIFYDVIEPTLTKEATCPLEVKVFTCRIAEKIFTICQGDLILKENMLDNILALFCNQKAQLPDSIEATVQLQIKNLWQSIRQKVFPNYSAAGYRSLISWLVTKLTEIKHLDSQDELIKQLAEVIQIVAAGRMKTEEESQQLIRLPSCEQYGGGSSSEFFILLPPLLFWLEYSIDREERLVLFQQLYQTIKDVLVGLPPSQASIDIPTIIMPSLKRTSDYLRGNSPNLSMLKFLDIVLTDLNKNYTRQQKIQPPIEVQLFFVELLENFICHIPYSLYEDVLSIFEKLLALCTDVLTEKVIKSCLVALVDKYTMKTKSLKMTVQNFMKFLLENNAKVISSHHIASSGLSEDDGNFIDSPINQSIGYRLNYFECMSDFFFFNNTPESIGKNKLGQLEFRSNQDLHLLFVEGLNFFVESLNLMSENHINVFTNLITHPNFKQVLLSLLNNDETQVRMKAHEIIEVLSQFFVQFCPSKTVYEFANGSSAQNQVMDAEFISHERLYISQIVIAVAKASLKRVNDCYLQFNSLILLDFLFQNLLPVPTFLNEQLKSKKHKNSQRQETDQFEENEELSLDVEVLSISETTPELDVMDPVYLRMRMKLVISLWPHIQKALNSPWSNIRSICYGLICSMLKVDVADYPKEEAEKISPHLSYEEVESLHISQQMLSQIVLPMLHQLLSSKESESKAGGLNILGSFCGLSYDFTKVKIHKHLAFFQRNSQFVGLKIWKLVFDLQDDWDITIKEASVVLIQLCAPRNAVLYFQSLKINREQAKLNYMQQMNKLTDIYSEKVLPLSSQTCTVRSDYAQRALSMFPTEQDLQEVVGLQTIQHQNSTKTDSINELFLSDRPRSEVGLLSSTDIILMSEQLAQMIYEFNPTYEDKRLTQAQQPLSRRRQIEIELNLNSKSKDQPKSEADPNFFVDKYTDDQIQEIVSIFRNDFKPPKNLWIEKQPSHFGNNSSAGNFNQAAIGAQSPDFFQEIYSEAIEQFNQYQMMMQQKQQDELQQQVTSGLNNTSISQSSKSSLESQLQQEVKKSDSPKPEENESNSSTPSPSLTKPELSQEQLLEINEKRPLQKEFLGIKVESSGRLEVPIGPIGPTSPVIVSNLEKINNSKQSHNQNRLISNKRPSLKLEKLDLQSIQILGQPQNENQKVITKKQDQQFEDQNATVNNLQSQNNAEVACENIIHDSNDQSHTHPVKKPRQIAGERSNLYAFNSNSAPDFNLNNQRSPKQEVCQRDSVENSGAGSLGVSGEHMISRKMAQTYLSGLSQGYIQNIDNLKLIKTCLNQQNSLNLLSQDQKQITNNLPLNLTLLPQSKMIIKTSQNQANIDNNLVQSFNYGSTKSSKAKKANLSNSPDAHHAEKLVARKSSKFGKKQSLGNQQKDRIQTANGNSQKQMNNLADLNYFIKYIEKDLNKKFKSMKEINQIAPTTPNNIMKKVEDQLRFLGVDTKFLQNAEQTEVRQSNKFLPQVKLLALNQINKNDEGNYTPSSISLGHGRVHKTSSPKQRHSARRSHDSDSEFSRTQRLEKKANALQVIKMGDKLRTHRESESKDRYLEVNQTEKLSSGRGASNNSAGQSYCQPLLGAQGGLLTDRSSQYKNNKIMKSHEIQRPSNTTRNDTCQQFQFKKGSLSKSQQKGYGALAGKQILSPQLKRDQQSGGVVQAQINVQNQTAVVKNSQLQLNLKKFKGQSVHGKVLNNNFVDVQTNNVESIKSLQTQRISGAKMPQSTRNLEQGDRKQFSPDSSGVGKPPLRKKKQGHSFASNYGQKPALVLQNPSYF